MSKICGIAIEESSKFIGRDKSSSCKSYVIFAPRKLLMVDRVVLPPIALDNREEVARYQARRIFDQGDLKATLYPTKERESQVECLLFAVEENFLNLIEEISFRMGIEVIGLSLASICLGQKEGLTDGAVAVRWKEGVEIAIFEGGKVTDVFWADENLNKLVEALKRSFSPFIEVEIETLTDKEIDKSCILFELNIQKGKNRSLKELLLPSILAISFLPALWLHQIDQRVKTELNKKISQKNKIEKIIEECKALSDEKQMLEQKIQSIERALSGLKPIDFIYDLAIKVPTGTVFTSVKMKEEKISINGYTDSVPKLIEQVSNIEWVKTVKILSSTREVKVGKYKGKSFFSISLEIKIDNKKENKHRKT